MAAESNIEWTHSTFNGWRGCVELILPDGTEHPACNNCYAKTMSRRNPAVLGTWGTEEEGGIRVMAAEKYWLEPVKWNKAAEKSGERRRVFCLSLGDVFEEWGGRILNHQGQQLFRCTNGGCTAGGFHGDCDFQVCAQPSSLCLFCGRMMRPATLDDLRRRLFALIDKTPWLDWLLLTKRPGNVLRMWPSADVFDSASDHKAYWPNIWLGTSVSNQQTADDLVPELVKLRDLCPVLFLSVEPLLGPVDLTSVMAAPNGYKYDALRGTDGFHGEYTVRLHSGKAKLDWIIAGGESGPHARPMHPDWSRSLRDQCQAAGVSFFFKQWGEWLPFEDDSPPLLKGQNGMIADRNSIPSAIIEHEPVAGWYWPCDPEHIDVLYKHVGKKQAGRMLDGREWSEFPKAHEPCVS